MPQDQQPQRCRLVLIVPKQFGADRVGDLEAAVSAGDVASVILPQFDASEAVFQSLAESFVPVVQQAGGAAILAGDPRIALRAKADGIHVEAGGEALQELMAKNAGRLIVGAGGVKTRDEALALGELQPDYLFFGRFGYDTEPAPHRRNLALGQWWAEMVEIPCIVMAGNDIASIAAVADTGAEFVAVSAAIWQHPQGPAEAVRLANALLDEAASSFGPDVAHAD